MSRVVLLLEIMLSRDNGEEEVTAGGEASSGAMPVWNWSSLERLPSESKGWLCLAFAFGIWIFLG